MSLQEGIQRRPRSTAADQGPVPRIIKQARPEKSEVPLHLVTDICVPNDAFYVRDHYHAVPSIDVASYRLRVGGLVRQPLALSLADIETLPVVEYVCTVECAGNGGPYGALSRGGVSTARWIGAPLAAVLDRAGVLPEATEIAVRGLDTGSDPEMPEIGTYERSIPLTKARHPQVILAYAMNGEPLPREHGYPLRLVIPGWYGMDWIKWVGEIEAIPAPSQHAYMTRRYREYLDERTDDSYGPMIREMVVKSLICRPQPGARLTRGRQLIEGVAWAGAEAIARVEVSTDGGQTWHAARITTRPEPFYWCLWQHVWTPEAPGRYTLRARAADTAGNVQPLIWPGGKYRANHVESIEVEVE
jgi:DMSO/TMAO reductase YedYZ molybdopterin-dependent catalytic subunit